MGFFSSSLFDVVWNWKDAGSVRIECVCVCAFDWFDMFEIFDGVCLMGCFLALSEFLPGMKKAAVIRFGAPMRRLQWFIRTNLQISKRFSVRLALPFCLSVKPWLLAMWLQSGRDQQWELWFFFDSSYTLYLCITESLICYVNTNIYKYD